MQKHFFILLCWLHLLNYAQAQEDDHLHWGCKDIDSADFARMEQKLAAGYEWIHPYCIKDTLVKKWTVILGKHNEYQILTTNSHGLVARVYNPHTDSTLVSTKQEGKYGLSSVFTPDNIGVYTFELSFDSMTKNRVGGAILAFKQKPPFQITKKDYIHDGQILQRVFVVIPKKKALDLDFLSTVICKVKEACSDKPPRHISFFREKEYADYKDNIFEKDGQLVERGISYQEWCENSYLGEYDVLSLEYISYPASYTKRGKVIYLKNCP